MLRSAAWAVGASRTAPTRLLPRTRAETVLIFFIASYLSLGGGTILVKGEAKIVRPQAVLPGPDVRPWAYVRSKPSTRTWPDS
ncbi:hypothetical protein GCM10027456_51110 [Kineosporia babensis]